MKKSFATVFVSLVMLVFVNFMFSNAIFTHVHKGVDGRAVTHSHPYLPSGTHSHTAHSLDLVAGFNLAAITAQSVAGFALDIPDVSFSLVSACVIVAKCRHEAALYLLRGPPAVK
ncbi:hypothetical protein IMSAG025_00160 [Muribaculaceae bacterium]|nr:hypothetical protein ED328_10200 [Muribaculaceae bacterium Isolate-001 (NCI)]GFI39023.1 hypothetical protein IMSAGC016_00796 [Muribaculaceae bacterium]GFI56733.1 hypothetical protein IMSAG025_00160 [Muribaculaceae bacterium]